MAFPVPKVGDVVCYSYLWAREHRRGQEEGKKDRPVVVIHVEETVVVGRGDSTLVFVAPISHSTPEKEGVAVEIPANIRPYMGLDAEKQWIYYDEYNRFYWPGFDVRTVPKQSTNKYGNCPDILAKYVKSNITTLGEIDREVPTGSGDG